MSIKRIPTLLALALLLFATAKSAFAQSDERSLVDYLPRGSNSATVVRVEQILATPKAQRENWAVTQKDDLLGMGSVVPTWAHDVVIGSQFGRDGSDHSGVVLMVRPSEVSMEEIAASEYSHTETLAGRTGVPTHYDTYYVDLADGVLGIRWPMKRADVKNWIAQVAGKRVVVADYLRSVNSIDGHIVVAYDLADARLSDVIGEYAKVHELYDDAETVTAMEGDVKKLRGIAYAIKIGEPSSLTLHVNFSDEPRANPEAHKTLQLSLLTDSQAMLPELKRASVKRNEAGLQIQCSLSEESLYLLTGSLNPSMTGRLSSFRSAEASVNIDASRRYLRELDRSIERLEKSSIRANNAMLLANLHEKEAEKLRQRHTNGVAPQILKYAERIHEYVRALAASLRGQAIEIDTLNRSVTWKVDQTRGGWVWGSGLFLPPGVGRPVIRAGEAPSYKIDSNLKEVREKQAQAVLSGANDRRWLWEQIWTDQYNVKVELRTQFGADFIPLPRRRTGSR